MMIIKIGGGQSINIENIIEDLKMINEPVIIVHGGNFMLDELTKKFGMTKKYYTSPNGQISRVTDQQTIEFMYMAYAGYMNKKIVAACQKAGINAIGLSGIDGQLVIGKRHEAILTVENGKKKIVRDDLTGTVEIVNKQLLKLLLDNEFVPVITPPVITDIGEVINTDGDKIAAQLANVLQPDTFLFLIEAPGVLTNFPNEKSLVKKMAVANLATYVPAAQGRMKKKLIMSKQMLTNGIKKIIIADGRVKNPVQKALKGKGTIIV